MSAKKSHENDIWDDSALVESWNEALEEYEKYHSMAAKGERVEHVLDAAEKAEEASSAPEPKNDLIDTTTGLPRWEPVQKVQEVVPETYSNAAVEPERTQAPTSEAFTEQTALLNPSQALLDSVQDENLKALMTSWYFAGYYTGLYEGQRKAQATQDPPAH